MRRLILVTCLMLPTASDLYAQQPPSIQQQIETIAASSSCAKTQWKDRGLARPGYFKGMAVVFAKSLCEMQRDDVRIVSARPLDGEEANKKDALAWYATVFDNASMKNDRAGPDTLRHAYTLLIGLGMRESSGKHCVGRDRSANFSSADSAEAGLFQTSWGGRRSSPVLSELFEKYRANPTGCLLNTFSQNVRCSEWDARTWGTGTGAQWQELTKSCPAFATEYAAVMLRTSGGSRGEFGPLRNRAAELTPACDAMLAKVQAVVEQNAKACDQLRTIP